jgi:uncharacterized protein YjiK
MSHYSINRMFNSCLNSVCIVLIVLLAACRNKTELTSPPEYSLTRPSIVKLPTYLDEISGITYYAKDKSVFVICDDKPWLYKVFLSGSMNIEKWKIEDKSDYEDIAMVDSAFYVLQSKGRIFRFQFATPDSVAVEEYEFPSTAKNEFEILYYEKDQNRLIMLCKDCKEDNSDGLSAWAFDLSTKKFSPTPAYVIDVRKIEALMKEEKVKFKPSAAAIHPLTGKLYIISSINKVLVVADKKGVPEKVYKIDPGMYKQPEGMTFSPEGHLIISNESAEAGAANILVFKYNKE